MIHSVYKIGSLLIVIVLILPHPRSTWSNLGWLPKFSFWQFIVALNGFSFTFKDISFCQETKSCCIHWTEICGKLHTFTVKNQSFQRKYFGFSLGSTKFEKYCHVVVVFLFCFWGGWVQTPSLKSCGWVNIDVDGEKMYKRIFGFFDCNLLTDQLCIYMFGLPILLYSLFWKLSHSFH